ncbi:MAG: hypothetical protein LKI24_14965 [Acidipropionibacterium sp.]|nr:hypothetical protein [Acidipropionibacterium sp.]
MGREGSSPGDVNRYRPRDARRCKRHDGEQKMPVAQHLRPTGRLRTRIERDKRSLHGRDATDHGVPHP